MNFDQEIDNIIHFTLVPKSFYYQFLATLKWMGQGVKTMGDNKRGEKGRHMLPEI